MKKNSYYEGRLSLIQYTEELHLELVVEERE